MKNIIYLILLLFVISCSSSRIVTTSETTTSRKVDTIVRIDPIKATFIPIYREMVEFQQINGINVIIKYKEVHITNDTTILQVEDIQVETDTTDVKVVIDETIKEKTKVKEITGIPFIYKFALYFTIGVIILIIIRILLKQITF